MRHDRNDHVTHYFSFMQSGFFTGCAPCFRGIARAPEGSVTAHGSTALAATDGAGPSCLRGIASGFAAAAFAPGAPVATLVADAPGMACSGAALIVRSSSLRLHPGKAAKEIIASAAVNLMCCLITRGAYQFVYVTLSQKVCPER